MTGATSKPARGPVAPGPAARRGGPLLLLASLALGLLTAGIWWQDRDLSDLRALVPADAEVVEVRFRARGPDVLDVRFEVDGVVVRAGIPSRLDREPGDRVRVAHVRDDPQRVRTVDGWSPAHQRWSPVAGGLGVLGLLVTGFGLLSPRLHGGGYEADAPAPVPRPEALGLRVVRASRWPVASLAGGGLVLAGLLALDGAAWGALVCLLAAEALALGLHRWAGGSDAVWVTPDALVARRRGSLRRWPWDRVEGLGTVTTEGTPVAAAARVDDGDDDGVGSDGWVTLARPFAGGLVAHRNAARLEQVARDRGLPYDDGLADDDLADTLHGRLQYRLRRRR